MCISSCEPGSLWSPGMLLITSYTSCFPPEVDKYMVHEKILYYFGFLLRVMKLKDSKKLSKKGLKRSKDSTDADLNMLNAHEVQGFAILQHTVFGSPIFVKCKLKLLYTAFIDQHLSTDFPNHCHIKYTTVNRQVDGN